MRLQHPVHLFSQHDELGDATSGSYPWNEVHGFSFTFLLVEGHDIAVDESIRHVDVLYIQGIQDSLAHLPLHAQVLQLLPLALCPIAGRVAQLRQLLVRILLVLLYLGERLLGRLEGLPGLGGVWMSKSV